MEGVSISLTKTNIIVNIPACVLGSIETLPAFLHKQRKANAFSSSLRNLPEVLAFFRDIHDADSVQNEYAKQIYIEEVNRRRVAGTIKTATFSEEGPLWEHQQRGVEIAKYYRRYGFYYDTRTGKTRMAYQIMLNALKAGKVKRCVVFVPSSIIPNWMDDAKEFPELKVVAFYKDKATQNHALTTPFHIMLISMELAERNATWINKLNADMCFVDESSKLKNRTTKISEFMFGYSQLVSYFYLLSATPAPNGYHEYYTQMRCIDPEIFPASYKAFSQEYFIDTSRDRNYQKLVIIPARKAEFESIIDAYAYYVDQGVMPTAGKKFIIESYDLPVEARECYDDMCRNMSVSLNGSILTVDMATAMRAKLQQIASGFIINTAAIKQQAADKFLGIECEGQESLIEIIPAAIKARTAIIRKIMLENGIDKKYVIWANYRQEFADIQALLQRCGILYGILNGSTSITDKEAIVDAFKHGPLQCIVCHPLSVGMGKNFTESHISIYYSLNDSWEAFKQSSERIAGHIKIQPKECLYYIILANNTVNALVYKNIQDKKEQSTGLLEHISSIGGLYDT